MPAGNLQRCWGFTTEADCVCWMLWIALSSPTFLYWILHRCSKTFKIKYTTKHKNICNPIFNNDGLWGLLRARKPLIRKKNQKWTLTTWNQIFFYQDNMWKCNNRKLAFLWYFMYNYLHWGKWEVFIIHVLYLKKLKDNAVMQEISKYLPWISLALEIRAGVNKIKTF